MPKQYSRKLRERTVRLAAKHRDEYETEYAAIRSIAAKPGIAIPESLRKWVRQAEIQCRLAKSGRAGPGAFGHARRRLAAMIGSYPAGIPDRVSFGVNSARKDTR